MTYLLDVNVLIALIDPLHVHHEEAHFWFAADGHASWATCPLTENAAMRIVGHPSYPNFPGSPAAVASILLQMRTLSGHQFWPDEFSLLNTEFVDVARLLSAGQLTDTYLLGLARVRGGQLASFDRRMVVDAVNGGRETLHLISGWQA